MLKLAVTYELFFNTKSWVTGFDTSTSSNAMVDYLTEMYGYFPTALSRYTNGDSPYIYSTTVPTITVAVKGLN